jgi:hypothetical protein
MPHPQAGSDTITTITASEVGRFGLARMLSMAFSALPNGGTVCLPDEPMDFIGELPPVPPGVVFKGGPNTRFVPAQVKNGEAT